MNKDNFINTTQGREAFDAYQVEKLKQHTALFDDIAALKQKRNDELKPLNAAHDVATKQCNTARHAIVHAEHVRRTAEGKVVQLTASYKHRIARIENQMRNTAPPAIDIFCTELKEEAQELRDRGIARAHKQSNAKSLNARLLAICNAISTAQAMKVKAVADITTELQQLRSALPAVIMQ